MTIHQSVLETVGQTPLVQLSRMTRDLDCELFGKLEFMNPGGSVKDRPVEEPAAAPTRRAHVRD